ncbi:MAG: LacI family transcriptional regulator [Candidatus Azobacteroides sp.]|nr:LacI family transcriptional regulator [Candidatus Azobacteroides sp.]
MDISQHQRRIRIKDIARLAGVSEGTVDRVIHHRGEVSAKSVEIVNEVLKKLNYSPNLFARSLASKKHYRVVCIIPNYRAGDYWEVVNNSFDLATQQFADYNLFIDKKYFDQTNVLSFVETVETVFSELPDAIILSPSFRSETLSFISKLSACHIPFSFINSMIEDTDFLTYYGQNLFQSGYVMAKLLLENLQKNASVLVVHTQSFANPTTDRYEGFIHYIEDQGLKDKIELIDVTLSNDEAMNFLLLKEIFLKHDSIKAAVVFNSKVYRLAMLLETLKQTEIRLFGYDLLEKNIAYLKKDVISYLIAQRPEKQVYCSVQDICSKLIFKQEVTKINYMPIDIVMKENIDYYINFRE